MPADFYLGLLLMVFSFFILYKITKPGLQKYKEWENGNTNIPNDDPDILWIKIWKDIPGITGII